MILFFDTETTGFVNEHRPASWKGQPHLVQLAAILSEDDGTERASLNVIVNQGPDVQIPKQASDVHRVTDEVARRCGVLPVAAVGLFYRMAQVADVLAAHNAPYDMTVMLAQAHRLSLPIVVQHLEGARVVDTAEVAAPVVDLPPTPKMLRAGFNKPKTPSLGECVEHFFGERLEGAHDAMVDVTALKRVYFALKERGALPSNT